MIGHQTTAGAELCLTLATPQSKFVFVALCHLTERTSIRAQLTFALIRAGGMHALNHHAALLIGTLRELRGIGGEHGGHGLREVLVVLGGGQQRLNIERECDTQR